MKVTVHAGELRCPKCGATEMHPDGDKLLIRGYKVEMGDGYWWSQCLVCAGYYAQGLKNGKPIYRETPEKFNDEKGWF